MVTSTQTYRTAIPVSAEALCAWHAAPGAFDRLTPPWHGVDITESQGTIQPGASKCLKVSLAGPFGFSWEIEHEASDSALGFVDVQRRGPFRQWRHEHHFLPAGDQRSILEDRVTWELPGGSIGHAVGSRYVESELDRLFAFRHQRTRNDLVRHANAAIESPLTVAITGSTGLVGRRLVAFLRSGGHKVVRLVRGSADGDDEIFWDPMEGTIDGAALEGVDAVVHLAGASIAGGRWTRRRKAAIRDSRVNGTHLLATTLAGLRQPPRVLVSTSAVGYFGDGGDELLTEDSAPGQGFLASVVQEWEANASPAASAGIRVVHPRFGVVMAGDGGMLPLVALPFKSGVGGQLGSGRQYLSWIGLDDLVGVLFAAITDDRLEGPVNAVSAMPVTNAEFTSTLASVLHRPSLFRVPSALMRLGAGELADDVILVSQRAAPNRLLDVGFQFAMPSIEQVLRHELGRNQDGHLPDELGLTPARRQAA